MKILFLLLTSFSISSVFADCLSIRKDIGEFIAQKVTVKDCLWNAQYVEETIATGLERICEINPSLINGIIKSKLENTLSVVCDVELDMQGEYPYFSIKQSTIHVWKGSNEVMRTRATIFHEFLHYLDLPYEDEIHNGSENLESDPVYACHLSAYPEVADRILGGSEKLPVARKTCAENLSFCDPETSDICWIPHK